MENKTKKIKSLLLTFFLLSLSLFQLYTQNTEPLAKNAPFTFDKVLGALGTYPYTLGEFTQEKSVKGSRRILRSYGSFIYGKECFVWNVTKPFTSLFSITADKVIQLNSSTAGKKKATKTRSSNMFLNIFNMVKTLFSGDASILTKNFNITFASSQDGDGWRAKIDKAISENKDKNKALISNSSASSSVTSNNTSSESGNSSSTPSTPSSETNNSNEASDKEGADILFNSLPPSVSFSIFLTPINAEMSSALNSILIEGVYNSLDNSITPSYITLSQGEEDSVKYTLSSLTHTATLPSETDGYFNE